MAEDNSSKAVWFLTGAAIGAAVAILYAPASGEVTRRRIVRRAEESADVLSEKGQELVERGRELYQQGRKMADEAADLFDRGRNIVEG
ncbi:MAG: YtxH domain-containing protein [Acidobacteriota bacterium]